MVKNFLVDFNDRGEILFDKESNVNLSLIFEFALFQLRTNANFIFLFLCLGVLVAELVPEV